jgi:hypothetical protein
MQIGKALIGLIVIVIICLFHILALMRLYPLYITSPLLFIAIYVTVVTIFHRKTFRGFTK